MAIDTTDNWGEKAQPIPHDDSVARTVDKQDAAQVKSFQAGDQRSRARAVRAELWNETGRIFADEERKSDAERKVMAYCDQGYIDTETRDAVIDSFRLRTKPPTIAERKKALDDKFNSDDSAFTWDKKKFDQLWAETGKKR